MTDTSREAVERLAMRVEPLHPKVATATFFRQTTSRRPPMTPEISLLEAELEQAQDLVKSRRHRLQAAKDAYWTNHFRTQGVVEGETVVIAKDYLDREFTCVIRWTNRICPCMIRRKKDGSATHNPGIPTRLKEIVKCFSNS